MQLELGFLYLAVWLMMLWLGSVALEATGMERSRAHFQALSALSGTGFTTKDAETVVNHSSRRWIVTWLMFFGNAGFITILILIIFSLQSNFANLSPGKIVSVTVLLIACGLLIWLGMVDKVSNSMVRLMRKRGILKQEITDWDLLHREGAYGVFRIAIHAQADSTDSNLHSSLFWKPSITIMAVERDGKVNTFPSGDEQVSAGDMLLCFGKVKEVMALTKKN